MDSRAKMKKMNSKRERNLYHNAFNKILSSNKKEDAINIFKNTLDYNVLCEISDTLAESVKPLNFTVYGNPLPENLKELGKSATLYKPKSTENEINWTLVSVRKYSKKISIFIILKKEFESKFLLGDYEKADIILDSILCETGYSLWYIESKFLLLEYQNKSEEQKEFLSEINRINKNGIISTIANFLSFRTERNLSAYKYDSDINFVFKTNKNELENDIREYYLFRLNFYENYSLESYAIISVFENCNSIIDRYLVTKDILKLMAIKNIKADFVYSKVNYLYRKTNDAGLLPLLHLVNQKVVKEEYYDGNYVAILDLYYSGFYQETINECKKYIQKNTDNFDLIVIYVKCHINLKINSSKISEEVNCLLNQIVAKVHDLLSSNRTKRDLFYNLYQINKNILSFDIASGLDYFLKKEQNYQFNKKIKLSSLKFFDPYFSSAFSSTEEAVSYLSKGMSIFPNSISIKHKVKYLKNELTEKAEISSELYSIDKAKILFNQQKYYESINEWQYIVTKYFDNQPIIQTALKYWFDSNLFLENYNESVQLFVNNYLNNPNSVSKINSNSLLEILRRIRYRGVKRTIDLPIFVNLTSNDDTEKSFVLEQYCKIFGATIPSELFDEKLDDSLLKNELLYNNVCNSETLKHSIYINTTTERLTERLKVINHLIEIFPEKSKIYLEELSLISDELIVYQGTQKLEESKIYANDQAIINYELNEIEGLFSRYKTIHKLSLKDKKILIISKHSYAFLRFDGKDKYDEQAEVKYTDSALLEVFHELFDSVLEKYLYSKFGIVAYLSTRIRHGVLLGEIRPEIEKQNLILNRVGSTNVYEESKFWNQRIFNLNSNQKSKLHEILTKFSLNIDSLIEEIIRDKIQIRKGGKNDHGLFNYDFEKAELLSYSEDLAQENDVKSFSQKVIDIIWRRTDANLEVIRDYIGGEIKTKFSEEINNLDKELRVHFSNSDFPQIFTNLIECTNIIENKVSKISSWFRRSGSAIDDFDIAKVFDIVWNNTQRCYPKISVECSASFGVNPVIMSKHYIHFTDLFRIMLDNMFKYGEPVNGKKKFSFETYKADEFIVCRFTNLKAQGIIDVIVKSKDGQLVTDSNKIISEKNSGFSKAIKIVKFDLGNENNLIRLVEDNSDQFVIEIFINTFNLTRDETYTNS